MGKQKFDLGFGVIAEVKKNWKVNGKIIAGLIGDMLSATYLTYLIFLMNPMLPAESFGIILSFSLRPYIMSFLILIFRGQKADLEGIIIQQESENLRRRDVAELAIELAGAKPERVEAIKESIVGITSWNLSNKQLEHLEDIKKMLNGLSKTKKEGE